MRDYEIMNFYHQRENVDLYNEMARNYDPGLLVKRVREYLPNHSTLLELGMGPGTDLLALSKYYEVTGSDVSPVFLDDFRSAHLEIEVLEVDAANFSLDRKFDCIFSNKVLYHLSVPDVQESLRLQVKHLNDGGIIVMTLWYGAHREEFYEGLRFVYYTEQEIRELIPDGLKIETIERYTEMEQDDSLLVVLKR